MSSQVCPYLLTQFCLPLTDMRVINLVSHQLATVVDPLMTDNTLPSYRRITDY